MKRPFRPLPDNQPRHIARLRTKRHTHADFMPPLYHGITHHSANPHLLDARAANNGDVAADEQVGEGFDSPTGSRPANLQLSILVPLPIPNTSRGL